MMPKTVEQPQTAPRSRKLQGVVIWMASCTLLTDGNPNLLSTNRDDDGRWLYACSGRPDDRWNRGNGFAFVSSQIFSFLLCFGRGVLFLPTFLFVRLWVYFK